MAKNRRFLSLTLATFLSLSLLVAATGCSSGEKEPTLQEIWEKSESGVDVKSFSMRLSVYYLNTAFGSGIVQENIVNVNGDDLHVQSSLFGADFLEVIKIGDKQYRKMFNDKKWREEQVSVRASDYSAVGRRLSDLPNLSTGSRLEGKENMGGEEVYHLVFEVSPENVTSIFPSVSTVNLSGNQGARIDVWVRASDYMRIKYEALVKGVSITDKIGKGDVRIVVELSNINQPITINPPS